MLHRTTYQPLIELSGYTLVSSYPAFAFPSKHENRPDTMVGRLHYSLSITLSAHFR
jgi:hypothetical protein